jgi:hypothetical protein
MSQEVSIEEVLDELQSTPEGVRQLELATLHAVIKKQQAYIQELKETEESEESDA